MTRSNTGKIMLSTLQITAPVVSGISFLYFDRIRNGVIELNKTIEEYAAEHPEVSVWYLEEAVSPDGMEHIESCVFNLDERGYTAAMDIIREFVYNRGYSKYYIEYVNETDNTVEFKVYGAK